MNQYRKSLSDFRLIQVLLHVCMIMSQNSKWIHYVDTICFRKWNKLKKKSRLMLQSRTKLLEKVFPIMCTFLRNKTISKTTPLRKKKPFPQFNVASHKRPGIRLSFEYTTTLLSGEGGEGRSGTAIVFPKMLSKYTIFPTVLSKIVEKGLHYFERNDHLLIL